MQAHPISRHALETSLHQHCGPETTFGRSHHRRWKVNTHTSLAVYVRLPTLPSNALMWTVRLQICTTTYVQAFQDRHSNTAQQASSPSYRSHSSNDTKQFSLLLYPDSLIDQIIITCSAPSSLQLLPHLHIEAKHPSHPVSHETDLCVLASR